MQKDKNIKIRKLLNIVFSKRIIIIIAIFLISLLSGYRYTYYYKQSEQYNAILQAIIDNKEKSQIAEQLCNMSHKEDLLIFGTFGAIVSGLFILIMYFSKNKIKSEKDIKRYFNIPVLGAIPISSNKKYALTTYINSKTYIAKTIKSISTNILRLIKLNKSKSILITNLDEEEGKTWIANNLAVAFAQANKKTILLDCNLRVPSEKSDLFGVEAQSGLASFIDNLTGTKIKNIELSKEYIQETAIPNLHLLVSGSIPSDPVELVSSNNMNKLIQTLKYMYDVIILETYDCLKTTESIALAYMVDETILVTEGKKTKINDIKKSKKLIENVDGKILGIIFNQKKQRQKGLHSKLANKEVDYASIEYDDFEDQEAVSLQEIINEAKIKVREEQKNGKSISKRRKKIIEKEKSEVRIVKIIKGILERVLNLEHRADKEDKDISLMKLKHKSIQEDIKSLIDKNNSISTEINSLNLDKKYILNQVKRVKGKREEESEEFEVLKNSNEDMVNEMKLLKQQIQTLQNEIIDLKQLDSKIEEADNQISQAKLMQGLQINNINKKIEELKELQKNNNSEILEKIAVINPEAILNTIKEKQETKPQDNVISFDKIREDNKRKQKIVKKSFSIDEDITFVELEKTSVCVLNFDSIEDNKNANQLAE